MRPATKPITDLDHYPKKFITPIQLAMYLGVGRRTIYHHIDKGALRVVKRVGVIRIPIEEARRYVSA